MNALVSSFLFLALPALPFALFVRRRVPALPLTAILACLPVASIAVVFTVVMFWPGSRIDRTAAVVTLLVALIASGLVWLKCPRSKSPEPTEHRTRFEIAVRIGAIALACAVGGIAWMSGIDSLHRVPPNFDAAHHGFMTARIIETGSNAPDKVILAGPITTSGAGGYYPLGVHSVAAMAVGLGDAPIADVLNALVVLFGALVFPLAAFSFVDQIVPNLVFAAPAAAVAAVSFDSFPYKPIGWGGIPLIIGNIAALALVALLASIIRRAPRAWPAATFGGLSAVGLWHVHNTELVLAAALLLLMLVLDLPATPEGQALPVARGSYTDALSTLWRVAVVSAALLIWIFPSIVRGGAERSSFDDTALGDPLFALGQILFTEAGIHRHGALLLMAIAGMLVLVRRRKYALPSAFLIFIVGAYWTATTNNEVSRVLTLPWWRQAERMMYVITMIAALGLGIAAAALIELVLRTRRRIGLGAYAISAVIALIVAVTALVPGAHAGRTIVYRSYLYYSPISRASRDGFAAARQVAGSDGTVLNDFNRDASIWMYAYDRVQPVFALALAKPDKDPSWIDRQRLLNSLGLIGGDQQYDELIAKYRVRAVYYDETTFDGSPHSFDLSFLRSLRGLREVFHEDSVTVFEVVVPTESR